jgi:hypothetical protein
MPTPIYGNAYIPRVRYIGDWSPVLIKFLAPFFSLQTRAPAVRERKKRQMKVKGVSVDDQTLATSKLKAKLQTTDSNSSLSLRETCLYKRHPPVCFFFVLLTLLISFYCVL